MALKGLKDMSIDPSTIIKSKDSPIESNEVKLRKEKKAKNPNRQSKHKGHKTKGSVCMKMGSNYIKVNRTEADKLATQGWAFCPRKEYRLNVTSDTPTDPAPKKTRKRKETQK